MKCVSRGCKKEATTAVEHNWGEPRAIHFCEDHAPEWLKSLKVGEFSPPASFLGIKKSWYKKIM